MNGGKVELALDFARQCQIMVDLRRSSYYQLRPIVGKLC
jgi:hypothetical protein